MNQLRAATQQWEFQADQGEDWGVKIIEGASTEADLASRRYVSTEHLILALIELWPEAPCSQMIIQAAGGSMSELRQKMKITW